MTQKSVYLFQIPTVYPIYPIYEGSFVTKGCHSKKKGNCIVVAAICPSCEETVWKNQKCVLCEVCMSLKHACCSGVTSFNVKQVLPNIPLTWTCCQSLVSLLPLPFWYKVAKDHNCNQTGVDRKTSPFYDEIDSVLGHRDIVTFSHLE